MTVRPKLEWEGPIGYQPFVQAEIDLLRANPNLTRRQREGLEGHQMLYKAVMLSFSERDRNLLQSLPQAIVLEKLLLAEPRYDPPVLTDSMTIRDALFTMYCHQKALRHEFAARAR